MPTPFCAMTWNVENLFPPGFEISPNKPVTDAEYQAKLAYLEQRVRGVQPDVLALQEIGSTSPADSTSFDALAARLQDVLPHRKRSSHPDSRPGGGGIRVAFLSRLPILAADEVLVPKELVDFVAGEFAQIPDFATEPPRPPITRMSRGILCIDVEPAAGIVVRLVVAHLKSKLVTYPGPHGQTRIDTNDENERARGAGLGLLRRTAEAVTIRTYLNQLLQVPGNAHVMLLGDLNDEPRAATTQLLLGPADSDATSPDGRDPVRLYNLCDAIPLRGTATKVFLPADQRFSRIYEGRGELIDHVMVSRSLLGTPAQNRQDQWLVKEVRSLVDSIQGQSIGNNPAARVGKDHPDHAPIVVRFEL
jgi:endonuclease/exonuclease/phosphatase family metal-dependent hydrolase